MAYTVPRTWVTGEIVTAQALNTNVRNQMLAMYNAPRAYAYAGATTQSIPNVTSTAVQFTKERWDTDGMVDLAVSTTKFMVQTAGLYLCIGWIGWQTNASGRRIAQLFKGTTEFAREDVPASATSGVLANCAFGIYYFSQYEQFGLNAYQSSGGALTFNAAGSFDGTTGPALAMAWIGAMV